jgi:hypothetical protein
MYLKPSQYPSLEDYQPSTEMYKLASSAPKASVTRWKGLDWDTAATVHAGVVAAAEPVTVTFLTAFNFVVK